MEFGASIFFTDYSITPAALAVAMEERGFDSVWAAEHSHIPVPRRTRADSELGKRLLRRDGSLRHPNRGGLRDQPAQSRDRHLPRDPARHDPDRQARRLARPSPGGRFLFGIGGGWNQEEIENHGTVFGTRMRKMREQIEAMKAIWTETKPEYHGELVDFGTIMTWPKPVQKPHPPVILGGAFPWAARRPIRYGDGWYPNAASGNPEEYLPAFRKMAQEAGRDPASLPVTIGGAPDDLDKLKRFRDLGAVRVNVSLMSQAPNDILPTLDKWAGYIRQLRG